MNTSPSWGVIDPDCDEEVAGITNRQSQHQVNRPANANTDSDPSNLDLGLEQVSDTNSKNDLGTLYNQDFFVADTMNRRLNQILNKSNYPYPLPNGHAALQLRLPDLLIYLKTDSYLMDVNTGEHYAIYSDKIQKMSVTPKLYLAWGYRQLLHTIQSDALRFGVNSPQPSTSGVSQKAPTIAGPTQPSPVSHYTQPPASPCRPTIVKYEPSAFSLKVQQVQKNQHIHMAIKLQHILETDDKFRRATRLPRLDIPKHLWGVRDMRSAHTREQDFMAITAEVEVLCQQLKGRGMYTIPSMASTTSSSKTGSNVHFQPIDPAQKSSVQAMNQLLLNSSLNLLDDSPQSQSSSSKGPIPHGQATPPVPTYKGNYPIPPTLYINQTAVDQHMRAQPAPIPPRTSMGPMNVQSPKQVPSSQIPDSVQPQRLPFVNAPRAPAKKYHTDNTSSPSTHETTSKSSNKQGIKQSSSESSSASTLMGKSGPICWNCGEVGHRRHNCQNPSYCSKCKQSGQLPVKCPLKGKKMRNLKRNKRDNRRQWIHCSQVSGTNASTAEVITHQAHALRRHVLKLLRMLQVTKRTIIVPLQVRLTLMIFLLLAPRTANQLLQT